MRKFTTGLNLAVGILTLAGYAVAADKPAPAESKDKAKQPQSQAAQTIFIDPATGKTRPPTEAELEELNGAVRARTAVKQTSEPERLEFLRGAGGAVGVNLGAESLSYMVVTRTPDGKLSLDCVTGDKLAAKTAAGK